MKPPMKTPMKPPMKPTLNQSDWQAVRDAMIADDRAILGEPPTVDELLAYERGELPKEDAERVQQLLVAYPELARAYATPFPSGDAQPGDSDYVGNDVIDSQWNAFRASNGSNTAKDRSAASDRSAANVGSAANDTHTGNGSSAPNHGRTGNGTGAADRDRTANIAHVAGSNGRVLQFWHRASASVAAIAATVAIVFGAMLWQTRTEQLRPHVLPEAAILTPDGRRGGTEQPQAAITPSGDSLLLVVSLAGATDYETYRLELINTDSHKRLWTSDPLPATTSNSFNIEIPPRGLPPGTYQMIAYGLRGNAQEQVATYTINVHRASAH